MLENSVKTCPNCEKLSVLNVKTLSSFQHAKNKVEQLIQNSIFSGFMMNNLINDLLDLGKL